MKVHLFALKVFGYMIFDDQKNYHRDYVRGIILTVSFILFNITQVRVSVELSHFEKMRTFSEVQIFNWISHLNV